MNNNGQKGSTDSETNSSRNHAGKYFLNKK